MDELDDFKWAMYRGLVCAAIERHNLIPHLDCDVWQFASSLDMSFEETKNRPIEEWEDIVEKDLREFMQDIH